MGGHDKASAWIVGVAAFLSGLILGFVLPRRNPPAPYVEPAPAVAPMPVPGEAPVAEMEVFLDGPLMYSTAGLDVEVRKDELPVGELFTAERLRADAEECGRKKPSGYFGALLAKFDGADAHAYRFTYGADGADAASAFKVTVVPNAPEYETLAEFREDFDICAAGGERYPHMASPEWLVFVSSCPGADFGDGMAQRCEDTRRVVLPSLQLKSR